MKKGLLCLGLVSMFISGAALADKTSTGFDTWKCTKCHSDAYEGSHEFPRLEGMPVKFFVKAMKDYQTKARHNYSAISLMSKRVKLDDQTIAELAEFFNKLPTKPGAASDPALIALGKDIYENGIEAKEIDSCASCHGKVGQGKGKSPRLAGQYIYFQVNQLKSYADGSIAPDEDMTELSKKMTDAEMEAVSAYLQSL